MRLLNRCYPLTHAQQAQIEVETGQPIGLWWLLLLDLQQSDEDLVHWEERST